MNLFLLIGFLLAAIGLMAWWLFRSTKGILDLGFGPSTFEEKIRTPRRFIPGTKPMSVRLQGSAFRYQEKQKAASGEEFYKVFIDGGWKWKGQQRFAGVVKYSHPTDPDQNREDKINTGHYFALTKVCARLEIRHYVESDLMDDRTLMEVQGEIDDMLDLTRLENIREVAKEMNIKGNIWDILKELTSEDTGGGQIPSLFGYYAHRNGYNGIVFFSARAMDKMHAADIRESRYWDDVMEEYTKTLILEQMQQQFSRMCVVVFSGSVVTRFIQRYRYDNGPWEKNAYYGYAAPELDAMWGEFNTDYQQSQGRVIYMRKEGDDAEAPDL